jgi:hypothetical protein
MSVFNNPNKPAGLAPVASMLANMDGFNGQGNIYAIAPADTAGYWPGDLVTIGTTAGNTFGVGFDPNGIPIITKYVEASTHPVVGVIQAIGIDPTGSQFINPNVLGGAAANYPFAGPGGATYRPAAAQSVYIYAFVLDDPNIVFEIQEGGAGTNLAPATMTHFNADVVVANPGTIGVTAQSGTMLDNATLATTATLPLRIYRFVSRSDNGFTTVPATGGGFQKWLVTLNNHIFRTGIVSP